MMNTTVFYSTQDQPPNIWDCFAPAPSSTELRRKIYELGPQVVVTMMIPCVFLFIMFLIFIEETVFLFKNSFKWKITAYKLWILSSYPAIGTLSLIALFIPKAAGLTSFTISFYFVIVIKKYFNYIMYLYGGKHKICQVFRYKTTVNAHPAPCCFCFWCKRGPMTMRRLHMLQGIMYHGIVMFPVLSFIENLLRDEGYGEELPQSLVYSGISLMGTITSFLCIYALSIINKSSKGPLQEYFIEGKFRAIQGIIVFNTIQGFILKVLGLVQVLPCYFPYPNNDVANTLQVYLIIIELFPVSLLARFSYRRTDSAARVIPYPPLDSYGKPLPLDVIDDQHPVKVHHFSSKSMIKLDPYTLEEDQESYKVQIDSISSDNSYFNDCFIPDF